MKDSNPKAQHPGHAMGTQSRIAPVPETIGQKVGQTDAALLPRLNLHMTVQFALTAAGLIGAPLMVWLWLLGSAERRLLTAILPGRGL